MQSQKQQQYFKKSALRLLLGLTLLTLFGCTRCPQSKYGNLLSRVQDPASKNKGEDLKGWSFETVVSKADETHRFYRYPSNDPTKPTFVFLHGIIFDGRNFLAFNSLAKHFNLIAYDMPDQSQFFKGNMDDFSMLLLDFFKAMGLERIHLGGVSLGGQIAMIFATKERPVAIDGLLLISTDMAKTERELKKSRRLARATEKITKRDEQKTLCVVTKLLEKNKQSSKHPEVFDRSVLHRVAFYNQVLDTSIGMTTPIPLNRINAPTLIIHGDKDTVIDIEDAKGLATVIPNAEFITINGGEHAIAYTHTDTIVDEIKKRFVPNL